MEKYINDFIDGLCLKMNKSDSEVSFIVGYHSSFIKSCFRMGVEIDPAIDEFINYIIK